MNSVSVREDPQKEKNAVGMRAGVFGLISNALLFVAKLIAGIMIRSISVTADAFNNLSDGASSVITVAGYKISARPADREHPYGHARFEYIAALVVSVIMIIIGALFLKEAITEIFTSKGTPDVKYYVYIVLGVSIPMKGAQALIYGISYRKTHSLPMKAAAMDSVGDVAATSAALLSTILWDATGLDLDGYFGAAIALFIVVTAVRLMKDSVSPLLGTAPVQSLVEDIKEKILSHDGVLGVHDLTIHSYGEERIYAIAHIEVSADESLTSAHELIDHIEREVGRELGVRLVAHIDPANEHGGAIDLSERIRSFLSERFSLIALHDFRVIKQQGGVTVYFDAEMPWETEVTAEELVEALKKEFDPSFDYVIEVDKE